MPLSFLAPFALLALLPLAGIIILLYLLKLKRRELVIPSIFLWRRATQDIQANAPFQKLRRSLLLLLQLLALLLMVAALAGPFFLASRLGGKSVVIVLDASASMNATDVRPSRFEEAKRRAREILGGMGRRDEAALVVGAARAWVASPFTSDGRKLQEALQEARPTDGPTNMRDALLLAFSLASKRPKSAVYVLSDGGFAPLPEVASPADLRFLRVGKESDNAAVLAFEAARPGKAADHQVFLRIKNYSAQAKTAVVSIYQEDDLLNAHRVELKAGENHTESYRLALKKPGLLRAELEAEDQLAADDVAYAFAELPSATSVLLVTPGNLFLEQALLVQPEVSLYKTVSLSAKEAEEAYREYDVVIYDRVPPPASPTSGGVMLIAAGGTRGEPVSTPRIDRWEEQHPALKYVNLSVVRISKATALRAGSRERVIAEAAGRPLIVAGERPGLRTLALGWNFSDSDLPLRVGFPILLSNSVRWLAASGGGSAPMRIRPGSIVSLAVPPDAESAEVTLPDESKRTLSVIAGQAAFTESDRVGVYGMTSGDRKWRWAVDLRSAEESDLTPREEMKLGARSVRAGEGPPKTERHVWPYLALLAVAILLLEWRVYHRRY
jgi:Ca-activated chloride channel family protein